ncbi:MAG: peroxiredoxin [Phycisphaeraceae bacterium]|nr:peroxiredoxin [Phycisphaeraceae bacterium]MBX3366278.1 peroxiredoxin [Phycisphaeraceae bacterium]
MPLIEPGQKAPAFSLRDQHGVVRRLSEFRGTLLVIYFYPEDDTPLCTTEACQFRDRHAEIRSLGAEVVGISPDSPGSHLAFASKHGLPFVLLADRIGSDGVPQTCGKYGVWREKNMYGKRVLGMVRTTYLIDEDGVIVRRWDSVKTPTHGDQVLAELRARRSETPSPEAHTRKKQRSD